MVLTKSEILKQAVHPFFPSFEPVVHGFAPGGARRGLAPGLGEEIGFRIENLSKEKISGAAIDFRVGETIFLADRVQNIDNLMELLYYVNTGDIKVVRPRNGKAVLEPDLDGNKVYYIPSFETIHNLPSTLELFVDAKSTTGRAGGMCTYVNRNSLGEGENGPVICALQPYAFPLEVELGKTSLFQAVLRSTNTGYLSRAEILKNKDIVLFENGVEKDLSQNKRVGKEGLSMTYSTHMAFRAKPIDEIPCPIDMDARKKYDWQDFFDFIEGNDKIPIDSRRFYLLGTRERIALGAICGILTRESYESGPGTWAHLAGIIQAGFIGKITAEYRAPSNRTIKQGDLAAYVRFDRLEGHFNLDKNGYVGDYQKQEAPRLPRMFKPFIS